ncbi:Protein Jade-1 [Folsomia candida]|uniref:Protein Jade-1 n=1 Tax=Folsomia candida TaxID=158441 RepID=A0A226END3_FOLCA|nr:Protein Jade-1 [Folsomia candida]
MENSRHNNNPHPTSSNTRDGKLISRLNSHDTEIAELRLEMEQLIQRYRNLERWKEEVCRWVEQDFDNHDTTQMNSPETEEIEIEYKSFSQSRDVTEGRSSSTETVAAPETHSGRRPPPKTSTQNMVLETSNEMTPTINRPSKKRRLARDTSVERNGNSSSDHDDEIIIDDESHVIMKQGPDSEGVIKKELNAEPQLDTTPCSVCGSVLDEYGNIMVYCDNPECGICVHSVCYGIQDIPEDTEKWSWKCNPCREGLDTANLKCLFCMKLGGALKPVSKPQPQHMKKKGKLFKLVMTKWEKCPWAHLLCKWWITEASLGDDKLMEPIHVEKIPEFRWNLTCMVCHTKNGVAIMCYEKDCDRAFHPMCGFKARDKVKMRMGLMDTETEFRAVCKSHKIKGGKKLPSGKYIM